jgi:iron complex transport system permease protein
MLGRAGLRVEGRKLSNVQYRLLMLVLVAALVGSIILAASLGGVAIPFAVTVKIIISKTIPGLIEQDWTNTQDTIIWDFRMPRVLMAVCVGAGLSVVGTVLQALIRNPLADPYLLGVSAGASLGAVLVLLYGSLLVGGIGLSGGAFVGGILATLLLFLLTRQGARFSPARLVLAGVALAYLFQAVQSYVILNAPGFRQAETILYWLLGSLGGARWENVPLPSAVLVIGVVYLMLQARPLNAILAGDETASSLGINVSAFRVQMFLVTSVIIAVMVANSGAIAFVGLIVPHMARIVVGSEHRRLLPVAALSGAIFLTLVDLAARTVQQPQELPLSIVTAVFGVPFFLWLLRGYDSSQRMSVS